MSSRMLLEPPLMVASSEVALDTRVREYAQLRYFCDPFVHYACIQCIFGNKNTVSGSFQVLKYTVLSL